MNTSVTARLMACTSLMLVTGLAGAAPPGESWPEEFRDTGRIYDYIDLKGYDKWRENTTAGDPKHMVIEASSSRDGRMRRFYFDTEILENLYMKARR